MCSASSRVRVAATARCSAAICRACASAAACTACRAGQYSTGAQPCHVYVGFTSRPMSPIPTRRAYPLAHRPTRA